MTAMPICSFRYTLRVALSGLLSLMLTAGPAFAQILPPPDNDPPPMEEPEGSDHRNGGGPSDSLNSDDSFNSDDSDSDDSDGLEVLLVAAVVTLVVGGIYLIATESRGKDPVASHAAAEAMARIKKVEAVLEESASDQSPLTVLGQRPADSRELLLTPDQRRQSIIVTASAAAGEQLAFTVDRDIAELAVDGPLFVQSLDTGWQITSGGGVLSYVPKSQLMKLTGHRPMKYIAAAPGTQSAPSKP